MSSDVVLKCNECGEVAVGLPLDQAGTVCGREFFRKGDPDGVIDRTCKGTYVQALEEFMVCNRCFAIWPNAGDPPKKCQQHTVGKYGHARGPCGGDFQGKQWPECRETVADGGRSVGVHMCGKTAKCFDRKTGEWHCKIHSPEQQALRKAKRGPTRFEREMAQSKNKEQWINGMVAALTALSEESRCSCGRRSVSPLPDHLPNCTTKIALAALERPKNG